MGNKFKYTKRLANSDCTVCDGEGTIPNSEHKKFGSATMMVGEEELSVQDVRRLLHGVRLCPVCFDPYGNPRGGNRVSE